MSICKFCNTVYFDPTHVCVPVLTSASNASGPLFQSADIVGISSSELSELKAQLQKKDAECIAYKKALKWYSDEDILGKLRRFEDALKSIASSGVEINTAFGHIASIAREALKKETK